MTGRLWPGGGTGVVAVGPGGPLPRRLSRREHPSQPEQSPPEHGWRRPASAMPFWRAQRLFSVTGTRKPSSPLYSRRCQKQNRHCLVDKSRSVCGWRALQSVETKGKRVNATETMRWGTNVSETIAMIWSGGSKWPDDVGPDRDMLPFLSFDPLQQDDNHHRFVSPTGHDDVLFKVKAMMPATRLAFDPVSRMPWESRTSKEQPLTQRTELFCWIQIIPHRQGSSGCLRSS